MKLINVKTLAAAVLTLSLFSACKKDASSSPVNDLSDKSVSGSQNVDGSTTLVLRPGPTDGKDAYVNFLDGNANSIYGTSGDIPELGADAWTDGGALELRRFYIEFDSLVKVPATATVVSATLQLFGLPGSSITHPQGNSIYPGSPYNGYPDNSALVQKVTAKWKENTIDYANQPGVTNLDEAVIPSSTDQWNYNPKVDVTSMVKKMVLHPNKNFGFKVSISNENIYRGMVFASSEATTKSIRPKLTIVYQ